jgi:MoxR-like ATPase
VKESDPKDLTEKLNLIQANVEKVIIGKPEVVRLCLVSLLSRGHLLIEDIPGVGKTTLAQSLARSIDCSFQRIQFTSDLLPSDIIGVSVYDQNLREFKFMPGPIFNSIILADEINRTTPRTQSALLEAMNERQVTVEGNTYSLPEPFMVMATQNPMEHHGTYPLPDSQLDRFLMSLNIGYPGRDKELEILKVRTYHSNPDDLSAVVSADEVKALQKRTEELRIEESLLGYVLRIAQATRNHDRLRLGVSPRGALALKQAAKARAMIDGRDYVIPDDIKELAVPVLAHRIIVRMEEFDPEKRIEIASGIIQDVMDEVQVPL